jgi:hypothetical protein
MFIHVKQRVRAEELRILEYRGYYFWFFITLLTALNVEEKVQSGKPLQITTFKI